MRTYNATSTIQPIFKPRKVLVESILTYKRKAYIRTTRGHCFTLAAGRKERDNRRSLLMQVNGVTVTCESSIGPSKYEVVEPADGEIVEGRRLVLRCDGHFCEEHVVMELRVG